MSATNPGSKRGTLKTTVLSLVVVKLQLYKISWFLWPRQYLRISLRINVMLPQFETPPHQLQ